MKICLTFITSIFLISTLDYFNNYSYSGPLFNLISPFCLKRSAALLAKRSLEFEEAKNRISAIIADLRKRAKVKQFSAISNDQSDAFIRIFHEHKEIIPDGDLKNIIYFDAQNTVQKPLNTATNSKELVDLINDSYKTLLLRNMEEAGLLSKVVGMKVIQGQYNDYKGIKFAFDKSKNPDIYKDLERIFEKTAFEFEELILDSEVLKLLNRSTGLLQSPKHWFAGGLDDTSVDASGLYARIARKEFNRDLGRANPIFIRSHLKSKKYLEKLLISVESQRNKVVEFLSSFPSNIKPKMLVRVGGSSKLIPSAEMLEIFRKGVPDHIKGHEEYFKFMKKTIEETFPGIKLDKNGYEKQIRLIRSYFEDLDTFTPGVLNSERVYHMIENAPDDVISFDVAGLGAWNSEATAKALALSEGKTLEETVKILREQDEIITVRLDELSEIISESAKKVFGVDFIEEKLLTFSGDDGILKIPEGYRKGLELKYVDKYGPLIAKEKAAKEYQELQKTLIKTISKELKAKGYTSKRIRPTRVGRFQNGAPLPRSQLDEGVGEMENLEKDLRKLLRKMQDFDQEEVMIYFQGNPPDSFQVMLDGVRPEYHPRIIERIIDLADKNNFEITPHDVDFIELAP